jgi:Acyl-CoA dehydrogenases
MWWLSEERKKNIDFIINNLRNTVSKYSSRYWFEKDEKREYPLEFIQELEKNEIMGINIPTEYGGLGLGLVESDIVLEEIANSPGGTVASNSVHAAFFNNHIIVKYASENVKQKYLPEIAKGNLRCQVYAVTEPSAGFNTPRISTIAKQEGDYYIITGQKVFISRVKYSDLGILAARVVPYEKVEKKTLGIALFLVDLREAKNKYIRIEEIPNNLRRPIDTNIIYIENLPVPAENILGDKMRGFYYLMEESSVERTLIAGQCISAARYAIKKAIEYAKQRVVFPPDPIAKYQGIQFPLADSWIRLEAADWLKWKALECLEKGEDPKIAGYYANCAKYIAGEAAFQASRYAMWTLGGYGYSAELDIERIWRGIELLAGVGQISPHMVLNYVATNILGMPKSYGSE